MWGKFGNPKSFGFHFLTDLLTFIGLRKLKKFFVAIKATTRVG